jgi:hypothetical protein
MTQIDGFSIKVNENIIKMNKRFTLNDQKIKTNNQINTKICNNKNDIESFKGIKPQNINLKLRLSLLAEKQKSERSSETSDMKNVMTDLIKRLKF